MFSFTAETFLQVGLSDKARVVNVEVMESEEHVVISDCLASVNSHSQEFRVVDLTIMIEINALKHLIDFCCWHIELLEGSTDLTELQGARIIGIESSEGISEFREIECTRVNLVDEECESLDLKALWLSEVLDLAEHLKFVFVQKLRIVTCMVLLNVIWGKPGVLEALLSRDSLGWVFIKHFRDKVFSAGRNVGPVCGVESERLFDNITEDFFVVITFERRVSTQKDEKNDA